MDNIICVVNVDFSKSKDCQFGDDFSKVEVRNFGDLE